MKNYLSLPPINQPLLCTHITKKIYTNNKKVILYKPRGNLKGSIICHLGEVHKKKMSDGKIINNLKITDV
jgi:2-aminoethylphosphonate-pyruvate transaminase